VEGGEAVQVTSNGGFKAIEGSDGGFLYSGRRYNTRVITRGIRELVGRDWAAVRENKDAYWAARIDRLGPIEGIRIADELRRQMRLRNPEWPDARLREDDLLAHVRLAHLFRRASPTRRA
jgi:hypothetical protein